MDGCHGHPGQRAGRHRGPDLDPRRRPAGHGDRCPLRESSGAGGSGSPRPARARLDRNRAVAAPRASSAEQDHQGREELARGALRQAPVVVARPDARRVGGRPARPGRACSHGAVPTRWIGGSGPASTPSSGTAPSEAARARCRRTSSPTGRSSSPVRPGSPEVPADPTAVCIVGAARHTWREQPAPEPLDMWEEVARERGRRRGRRRRAARTGEPPGRLLPGVGVRRRLPPPGRTLGRRPGSPSLLGDRRLSASHLGGRRGRRDGRAESSTWLWSSAGRHSPPASEYPIPHGRIRPKKRVASPSPSTAPRRRTASSRRT